jgi:hypothetical protein
MPDDEKTGAFHFLAVSEVPNRASSGLYLNDI